MTSGDEREAIDQLRAAQRDYEEAVRRLRQLETAGEMQEAQDAVSIAAARLREAGRQLKRARGVGS